MIFWLIVAGLTIVALVFTVPPLWFKSTTDPLEAEQRKALNIAMYEERIAELDASALTAKQLSQAKQELEKTLLSEIDKPVTQTVSGGARWSAALVLIGVPALASGLYWHTGSPQAATQTAQQSPPAAAQQAQANGSMPSLDEMVGKLAQRLKDNPDDAKGWEMLGRSYVVMERYQEAVPAFAKSIALNETPDAELLSSYAETIAMSHEGRLQGQPDEILAQAIKLDDKHPKTLWLLGLSAVQTGDFATAIDYWETLKAQLPPGSESAQSIAEHIAELKGNQIDTGKPKVAESTTPSATAAKPQSLQISVTLDDSVMAQAAPEDILFIYARAAQGPRMPLAILRKKVKDLPITVTLDDSMAMMPTMKLSSVPQVIAMARVSKSGSAMMQSGDLFGESAALDLSKTNTVAVKITQQAP